MLTLETNIFHFLTQTTNIEATLQSFTEVCYQHGLEVIEMQGHFVNVVCMWQKINCILAYNGKRAYEVWYYNTQTDTFYPNKVAITTLKDFLLAAKSAPKPL